MSERARTLYLIACAAGPAREAHVLVAMAASSGWDVFVGVTPDGAGFVDAREVLRITGHPVRSDYRPPDGLDGWPRADAIVVAPATLNTVNKLAAGIADSFALSVLCECLGLDVPLIVAPNVNPALARHPRFRSSVQALGEWGVHVLYEPSAAPPIWMVSWEEILGALKEVRQRLDGTSPGRSQSRGVEAAQGEASTTTGAGHSLGEQWACSGSRPSAAGPRRGPPA